MPPSDSTLARRRRDLRSLTREDILDAAADIVDEGGYDALNMRALADRLGVTTPTVYRLIATKEQLLGALADRLLTEVISPPREPADDWEQEVLDVFTTAHHVLLEHPALAEMVAKPHAPALISFASAERTLRAFARGNVEGERAAVAFIALVSYTVGFTQRVLSMTSAGIGERLAAAHELDPDAFAHVLAVSGTLISRPSEMQFVEGLRVIVRGFTRELDR
jgi:AcrR family transcriptional regulator